jgi:hypothetical protein
MPDQTTILAWGCIFIGAWLAGYALHSIRRGKTRGYYQDHRYDATAGDVRFDLWVWLRFVLGVGCLALGLVAL